jgi:opacity protein-like surface antigen
MKWTLRNALIVVSLATFATPVFSTHAYVISGLDKAKKYHGKTSHNLFIRAGSFSSVSNAKHAATKLRSHTSYPVKVASMQGYHVVTIGPMATAAEVRQVAEHASDDNKLDISKDDQRRSVVKPIAPVVSVAPVATTESAGQMTLAPRVVAAPVVKSTSWLPDLQGSFYLSAGAGDLFTRVEGDNLVATGAGWPSDHYSSNDITDQPYFVLAGGYMLSRPNDWLPYYSLGLRMMYASTTTISGTVEQYSLPDFTNYNFKYDIQLLNILATLKLDLYRWKNLMPYVIGGVGLTNYSTSEYTEQALSGVTPRVSPAYGSNSGNNFSYLLGVGVDYAILDNLWINAEVNYMDFGSIATGKGQNYATLTGTNYDDQSLKNKISATSLFLGLTYFVS